MQKLRDRPLMKINYNYELINLFYAQRFRKERRIKKKYLKK